MRLRDFLEPTAIALALEGSTRREVLTRLVGLLALSASQTDSVLQQLFQREDLGSTGFGGGVALPHCRTLAVDRLRVAFGHHPGGIDFQAVDGKPVHSFFLIVAPPMEVSNQYLPVLGRIAQFLHDPTIPERLATLQTPDELLALLDSKEL
jgi:mannitol/fructose-specific phosphotransferase system IIA component (Ntr-type)